MTGRAADVAARFAAVPSELTGRAQWVVWRRRWVEGRHGRPGRWTKVPYQARAPQQKASSTDPRTWAPFAGALAALAADPSLDGIGFVLTAGDDVVGVDVDHCLGDDGVPDEIVHAVLALLPGTYCEVSPSGRGLRVFARGRLPVGGRRRGPVEVYETERFLTVTGTRFGDAPSVVAAHQTGIDAVHGRFIGPPASAGARPRARHTVGAPTAGPVAAVALTDDDTALLERMYASAAGARIRRLYAGDVSAYDGDASAADLALANHLLYWTDGDMTRADRLFRGSGLMRAKWDEQRGATTYGQRTLATAAASARLPVPARGDRALAVRPKPDGWAARALRAVAATEPLAWWREVPCR